MAKLISFWASVASIALCFGPATAQTPTVPEQPPVNPWTGIVIDPMGWTLLDGCDAYECFFYRLPILRSEAGLPRVWTRAEYAKVQGNSGNVRSVADFDEVDCVRRRSRSLQQFQYPNSNLGGTGGWVSSSPGPWTFDPPGTFGEALDRLACR